MSKKPKKPSDAGWGDNAKSRLLSLIERVERLEEERRGLADDIKEIKQEAKSAGFDVKTFNRMLAERKLSPRELEEQEALADIYRRALGMMSDTPLGEAALRRLTPKPPEKPPGDTDGGEQPPEGPGDAPDMPEAATAITPEDIAAAHQAGAAAARAGSPVLANPHPAGDPRRAAWDAGWCEASGSDGMDIPPAWRREPKGKK